MQLSERVRNLRPSSTLAVTARVRELKAAGADIIGFGAGEPDFDTPDHIKQVTIDALLAGMTKYMPVIGESSARQAIARKLQRENGIECTVDDICISVGGKHSLYLAVHCLVDHGRGHEVIILTPGWVSYRPMVELAGAVPVEVPGAVDNDFKVTPDQLAHAITANTRAVILNSPSNPCGTMYSPDEIRALVDVIAPHERVTLISDEIYEKLIFGGMAHLSPASLEPIAARTITINGLAKAYAMTGWRVGYACAPGGAAKAMARMQGQMTSCITSFCYPAIIEAIEHGEEDIRMMCSRFAQRAALIHGLVSAMPGVHCPKPTGAFYVFPDIGAHFGKKTPRGHSIESSVAFAEALLEEAGVAVVPGDDFGECAKRHVRLGFACSEQDIEEGCRRMHEWLDGLRDS